jgi:hypothetical protein
MISSRQGDQNYDTAMDHLPHYIGESPEHN